MYIYDGFKIPCANVYLKMRLPGKLPENFRSTSGKCGFRESFRKASGKRRRKYIISGTRYQMYMSGFFETRHIYIYIYILIKSRIL